MRVRTRFGGSVFSIAHRAGTGDFDGVDLELKSMGTTWQTAYFLLFFACVLGALTSSVVFAVNHLIVLFNGKKPGEPLLHYLEDRRRSKQWHLDDTGRRAQRRAYWAAIGTWIFIVIGMIAGYLASP